MFRYIFFAKFQNILPEGFRANLNFRKFKVSLNPSSRKFFKTLQKIVSKHGDYSCIIKTNVVQKGKFEMEDLRSRTYLCNFYLLHHFT